MTRRAVLAGGAALAGGSLLVRPTPGRADLRLGAAPLAAPGDRWQHGGRLAQRGVEIAVRRGRQAEGRFGIMFKKLEPFRPPDDLLLALADRMSDPGGPLVDNPLDNHYIPAGFTFLGQFIDHDMTFDRTPLTEQDADPDGIRNFDSPHFDLASVYGNGPSGSPELFDADGRSLKLVRSGNLEDVPRDGSGRAVIGDPRNDENLIVLQIHIAFMKLHNRLVTEGRSFGEAQQLTRWCFQWIIVSDYLPRVAGPELVDALLERRGASQLRVRRRFYKPKNPHRPMMPIEYSVAAFRFGHSMVRAAYATSPGVVAPTFSNPPADDDLHGSRPLPERLKITWPSFFQFPGAARPANPSRRIDTKLAPPLHQLPPSVVPSDVTPFINNLAQRNLLRGSRLGLPSGQDVALAMGVAPIANAELGLTEPEWGGKAPLWYYVLAEAERLFAGRHLGPVGGGIVAETILGILDSDKTSYFGARGWRPGPPVARASGEFDMSDLLTYARA